jgi:toxin ParE1/3/4
MLLSRAIKEIGADPFRPGSNPENEISPGVRTYHIRLSRDRARSALGIVRNPRHVLVYRFYENTVELLRVVHDAQDLDELGLKP